MNTEDIYIDIVGKLSLIKEDKVKLTEVLNFLENQTLKGISKEEPEGIPEDYESIVNQITEAVNNGFICFFNPDTLEIEQAADTGFYGFTEAEFGDQNEDMVDEYGLTYTEWDRYIKFEPFGKDDIINRMEQFVDQLNDQSLKTQLEDIDDTEELFSKFNGIMERTGYSDDWELYKRNEIEDYVKSQLISSLKSYPDTDGDIYSTN
ncbi:MAG: hypothetical protein E6772_09560 [Dysgonomonas sp.]|nr:hypothetical protein [Dysgonomonas sp.]